MRLLRTTVLIFLFFWHFQAVSSPQTNQELMATWIGLESQRGHLIESWRDRKADIEHKISLFEVEKDSLKELLKDATEERSEVDQERQALLKRQTELEQEQLTLEQSVATTLQQMTQIVKRLPPPLSSQWSEKLNTLQSEQLSTSEQLEGLLNLLKAADEFNGRVALNKGVISLNTANSESKKDVVVNQIYLGVGHGWYVSDDGSFFGYGKATNEGWVWWSDHEVSDVLSDPLTSDQVLDVLRILRDPTSARYISLPLNLN